MRKFLFSLLVLVIPFAVFAQTAPTVKGMEKQGELLKSLKLSDTQIAQVKEVRKALTTELRSDRANIQLLNAQIKVALLPSGSSSDLTAVDNLIDQKAALQASMQKAFVAARQKLIGIMGQDDFDTLLRHLRREGGAKRPAYGMDGERMRPDGRFGEALPLE